MSFSKVCISGKRSDPDQVYYNATIVNNETTVELLQQNPQITFGDNRQTPVVSDTSAYKLSVQDFTINGGSKTLPLFIPQMLNISNNETIYEVTLAIANTTNGSFISTRRIVWIPENQSQFAPGPAQNDAELESEYYYCYTYSHWVRLINNALQVAYADILSRAFEGTFGTQCPFFQYDPNTGLFSIYEDANSCLVPYSEQLEPPFSVASITAARPYQDNEYTFVGMNSNLENLLSNFSTTYYGTNKIWVSDGVSPLPEYVINMGITNLDNINGIGTQALGLGLKQVTTLPLVNPFTNTAIPDTSFVQLTQDYNSTGSMWSPIASIVIKTTQIPLRNEEVSNPILLGQENIGIENAAGGSFQKVLIETPINAVTAEIWRGWILYKPLIPIYSSMDPTHQGLSMLDFQVFWRNRLTNSLIPFRMTNNGSMSIRLLFEKK